MDIEKIDIGSFPLKHEVFARKRELGEAIARQRAAMRRAEQAAARHRRRRMATGWIAAVSVAAVVAAAVFMLRVATIATGGQTQQVVLPCGSTVVVYAHSEVSYRPHLWGIMGRTVNLLHGAACFSVEEGKRFKVETAEGDVTVTGTEFKVKSSQGCLEVECFEGSVMVEPASATSQSEAITLEAGEEAVVKDGKAEKTAMADTKQDETPMPKTSEDGAAETGEDEKAAMAADTNAHNDYNKIINFKNAPLSEVATTMERIFNITVTDKDLCEGLAYTGIFDCGDMALTLEVVFTSCGLDYTVGDNGEVSLSKIE